LAGVVGFGVLVFVLWFFIRRKYRTKMTLLSAQPTVTAFPSGGYSSPVTRPSIGAPPIPKRQSGDGLDMTQFQPSGSRRDSVVSAAPSYRTEAPSPRYPLAP
jgi:hypothetical protein